MQRGKNEPLSGMGKGDELKHHYFSLNGLIISVGHVNALKVAHRPKILQLDHKNVLKALYSLVSMLMQTRQTIP